MIRAYLAAELLRSGYKIRFRVLGTSMLPTIFPGSLVVVEPVAAHLLRRGDIVLSNGPGRLIAHRINEVRRTVRGVTRFVLRGDNLAQPDQPVDATTVLGRVTSWAANDNWRQAVGTAWSVLAHLIGRVAAGRGHGGGS